MRYECNKSSGFTLIEILVTLLILGIISMALVSGYSSLSASLKLQALEKEVHVLLRQMELLRKSALSTTIDSNGVYQRTFHSLPPGSNVSALQALSGRNVMDGNTNPFGFDYLLEINDKTSIVITTLPGTTGYGWAESTVVGQNTQVTFYPRPGVATAPFSSTVSGLQSVLYLEETRH